MNCEKCNVKHNGSYGSGRFCSSKCARGFSTSAKRQEINNKVSQTLLNKGKPKRELKQRQKEINKAVKIETRRQSLLSNACPPPFEDFVMRKVWHKTEERWYACLVPIPGTGRKQTTVSYARFLMSVHLGRLLQQHEEVDHIDNNKQNDVIENLQILTHLENVRKFVAIKYKNNQ